MKTTFKTRPFQHYRITLLALLLALLALPTSLWADNQAYARLDNDSTTLTFRYGDDKKDTDYDINDYVKNEHGFIMPVWCQDESVVYRINKVVFDASFADARPTNCSCWFLGMVYLTGIEGMENLNTSEVTNMSGMFYYCVSLTQLDLSHFDTSKVTDMSGMFSECSSLTQLDLSNFNTENVTNMASMFSSCKELTKLNFSTFNTSKALNMQYMFSACTELAALDLSNFNTSEVTNMDGMFNSCCELTTLDLSSFNTSKVTSMYYMFGSCTQLTALNISSFNTSQVTSMECMFYYCYDLKTLDLSKFNTENVTNMYRMFSDCHSLTKLDVSSFNTANVTNMWLLFYNCKSLPELDLYSFDTSAATNCKNMFGNNFLLNKIYVSDKFKITGSSTDMFSGCTSLTGYDTSKMGSSMANYTTGYLLKKFGSNGDEIFSGKSATLTIDDLQISDDKAFVLYEDCKATAASYSREMSSTWGTLCLPFDIDATADGNTCKFYTLQNVGNDYVALQQIEEGTINAGTPVVICKNNDSQTSVEIKATDAEVVTKPVEATTSDRLVGTFGTEILKDNGGYFIAKNKFFSVADYSDKGVKVNPFRAYIMCSNTSAPALRIDLNDDATGIDAAKAIDTLNDATAEYYDINGRRTTGVQKGLNIVRLSNGKTMKVFVK